MNCVISGSRKFTDYNWFIEALLFELANHNLVPDRFLFGDATGVDALALQFCLQYRLPYARYGADWKRHGKAAGPIRNSLMSKEGDILIAFPYENKGLCPGTTDMIKQMKSQKKPVHIIYLPNIH